MVTKSFKERFYQAVLQADSSDSLYKAFVDLSMENLEKDSFIKMFTLTED